MYRKIEAYLKAYFETNENKILIVDDARQIGKTYIITKIGKEKYKNFISINFDEDNKGHQIFKDVRNVDDFYIQLNAAYSNKLNIKEDALVFLDEISIYQQYFSLLKQLPIDNKYRYICSCSLLDVELNKTSLQPMGYVTIKKMYPMDFEEFLLANGFGKEAIEQVFSIIQ